MKLLRVLTLGVLFSQALWPQQQSTLQFSPGSLGQTATIEVPAGALPDDLISVPFPLCYQRDCKEHVDVILPDGRRVYQQVVTSGVRIDCHNSPVSNGEPGAREATIGHLGYCEIRMVGGGSLQPGLYQVHVGLTTTAPQEVRVWFRDDLKMDAGNRRQTGFVVTGPERFAAHASGELALDIAKPAEVFDLAVSARGVVTTLRLPDGREITPATATSAGIVWKVYATGPGSDPAGLGPGMFLLHKPLGEHHLLACQEGKLPAGRYVFVLNGSSQAREFIAVAEHVWMTEIARILDEK